MLRRPSLLPALIACIGGVLSLPLSASAQCDPNSIRLQYGTPRGVDIREALAAGCAVDEIVSAALGMAEPAIWVAPGSVAVYLSEPICLRGAEQITIRGGGRLGRLCVSLDFDPTKPIIDLSGARDVTLENLTFTTGDAANQQGTPACAILLGPATIGGVLRHPTGITLAGISASGTYGVAPLVAVGLQDGMFNACSFGNDNADAERAHFAAWLGTEFPDSSRLSSCNPSDVAQAALSEGVVFRGGGFRLLGSAPNSDDIGVYIAAEEGDIVRDYRFVMGGGSTKLSSHQSTGESAFYLDPGHSGVIANITIEQLRFESSGVRHFVKAAARTMAGSATTLNPIYNLTVRFVTAKTAQATLVLPALSGAKIYGNRFYIEPDPGQPAWSVELLSNPEYDSVRPKLYSNQLAAGTFVHMGGLEPRPPDYCDSDTRSYQYFNRAICVTGTQAWPGRIADSSLKLGESPDRGNRCDILIDSAVELTGVNELPCAENASCIVDPNEPGIALYAATSSSLCSQPDCASTDFSGDCLVNAEDVVIIIDNFGIAYGARQVDGDADCDGDVDAADLMQLLGSGFGADCR